jgi:hypothetical protein
MEHALASSRKRNRKARSLAAMDISSKGLARSKKISSRRNKTQDRLKG